MPELGPNKEPKDRAFFFNVLNTLNVNLIDDMVINARN